jgi:hypothetical protein
MPSHHRCRGFERYIIAIPFAKERNEDGVKGQWSKDGVEIPRDPSSHEK